MRLFQIKDSLIRLLSPHYFSVLKQCVQHINVLIDDSEAVLIFCLLLMNEDPKASVQDPGTFLPNSFLPKIRVETTGATHMNKAGNVKVIKPQVKEGLGLHELFIHLVIL